jgi:hypothetical protein
MKMGDDEGHRDGGAPGTSSTPGRRPLFVRQTLLISKFAKPDESGKKGLGLTGRIWKSEVFG